MKVWILQLMAVLLWVALHHHFMANAHDIYPHPEPKPIIKQKNTDEDWKANFTQESASAIPLVIINGLDDLCVEVDESLPKLVTCNESALEQRWQFLNDSTIRPVTQPLKCLTANDLVVQGIIVIVPCNENPSDHTVWYYRHIDKAIVNNASNLVIDAIIYGVPPPQILNLQPSLGLPSQTWYTEPLPPLPIPPSPSPPPPSPSLQLSML